MIDTLTRKFSFLVRNVCAKTYGFIFAKDGPGVKQPYVDDDESVMLNC